jgi:hypothetical protein
MWPFSKRKFEAQRAEALLDEVTDAIADKWVYFGKMVTFKDEVKLEERIAVFSIPLYEGLRKNFATLQGAPEEFLLMLVVTGISKSGTHSRAEMEQALGVSLPKGLADRGDRKASASSQPPRVV